MAHKVAKTPRLGLIFFLTKCNDIMDCHPLILITEYKFHISNNSEGKVDNVRKDRNPFSQIMRNIK